MIRRLLAVVQTIQVFRFKVKYYSQAIAAALRRLLSLSPTETREYQTRCREWVQALRWETVVQKHLEVYQQ